MYINFIYLTYGKNLVDSVIFQKKTVLSVLIFLNLGLNTNVFLKNGNQMKP